MNYNAVISVRDITDESGEITEPVTLAEIKNYLRLEGFQDASQIVPETPIVLTLLAGESVIQDDRLIDAVILSLAREGTIFSQSLTVGNRKFVFTAATGTLSFLDVASLGGEGLDIGYGYNNNSGVFNFTGDDDLLTEMITMARELIEEKSGLSIVSHKWEAVITNLCGRTEIPYGPVIGITSFKDSQGSSVDYTLAGNLWKFIISPLQKEMVVTYTAGFDDVLTASLPKSIKIDIMRLVAYIYEHRGDEAGLSSLAFQLSSKYSRNMVIV